jgi:carnitine O-acetyltransferase
MKEAFAAHKKYMTDATMGKGADRHLLGLRILAGQEVASGEAKAMPELFTDPSYGQSMYFKLSTSNVPTGGIFGGFGNMYPDGYGVCYHILENEIRASIVSRHACPTTSSFKLRNAIAQSLRDMRNLGLSQAQGSKL